MEKTGNSPLYKAESATHSPAPMTFVAASLLTISINLLLLIFVFVCGLMTLVILMQRPKQEGLGAAFGGGVTDQVFGAQTTTVLQRATVYLGSLFFIIALLLSVLIGQRNKVEKTVTDKDIAAKVEEVKPVAPAAEVTPKSLSEELPPEEPTPVEEPAPAATPAPVVIPDSPKSDAPADAAPADAKTVEPTAPADAAPTETPAAPADGAPVDPPKEP